MDDANAKPPPISLGLMRLVAVVVAALLASGVVTAVAVKLIDQPSAWRGFTAAMVVSLIAGLASVLPLWIGARFGVMGVVGGYFGASFTRAILAIGGSLLAIWTWSSPSTSTLLIVSVHYLAVLTAESALVATVLWNQSIPRPPESSNPE